MRAGHDPKIAVYFIGSVVYILSNITVNPALLVIDGQQRTTTICLLLEALAREVENYPEEENIEDFAANQIRGRYLIDPLANASKRYKLILTQTDKDTWLSMLKKQSLPKDYSIVLSSNLTVWDI